MKLLNFTVFDISKETKIDKSIVSRIMLRYESVALLNTESEIKYFPRIKNRSTEKDQKQSGPQILHIHAEIAACELPLYARNFPTKHRSGTYGPKNRKTSGEKGLTIWKN